MRPATTTLARTADAGSHRLGAGTGRALAAAAIVVTLSIGAAPGTAQDMEPLDGDVVVVLDADPVTVLPINAAEQRREELKRVLLGPDESLEMIRERKRRSPEERNALKQELREAMRGVYEQRLHAQQ